MIKHMDWFLALVALIVIYMISNNYMEPLTEQLYVVNTYLYILLAIIIVATSWSILDNNPDAFETIYLSKWNLIGIIVVTFASLFFTMLLPAENIVAKHVAWGLFVTMMGMMIYLTYLQTKSSGNLMHVGIILVVLIGILTWIAYSKPLDYFDSYAEPLLYMLTGLIVVELGDLIFFSNTDAFLTRFRVYSWITIVLFSGFLLYDTQKVRQNAITATAQCTGRRQLGCADYCNESLSIFLDIANLFNAVSNVSNN